MTPLDIIGIRTSLGLTSSELADLLGVHHATVHRWVAAADLKAEVSIEPLQLRLLEWTKLCIKHRGVQAAQSWGLVLRVALRVQGTLGGLSCLLQSYPVPDPEQQ